MWRTLIEKECKAVLLSPKFALTFTVCSVLILLSIGVGIREYRAFERQQEASRALLAEEQRAENQWMGLETRIFREADPLQIFATGVHDDVGRLAPIGARREARLEESIYTDDTLLAVFRQLDLAFIVQAVLSLFAILFTYDAINGERESGTLKLIFASAVPRARFVVAKLAGTWLGLAVPLLLPALLGLLAVVLWRVPLTGDDGARLAVFALASALYFTLFVALGVAVSALTRRPQTSFLVLLVFWVGFVLVVPRAALLAAVELRPVPSVAEIEAQKAGFEAQSWATFRKDLEARWRERNAPMAGMSPADRDAYEDDHLWDWLQEDDEARNAVETTIADRRARLDEDLRQRKAEQQRLAFGLSRVSPASAYQLAVMALASTDVDLKTRYEAAAREYGERFREFTNEGTTMHVVSRRGGHGGGTFFSKSDQPLDLAEMPRFEAPRVGLGESLAAAPLDLGILGLEILLLVAVGFAAFLRYDVR